MEIGKRIKDARTKLNLTQKQLAEMSELAEITIRQYESGKREPKKEMIEKISAALRVSPIYLIWGQEIDVKDDDPFHPWHNLDEKLKPLGCSISADISDGYIWIVFPDGTLEVSEDDLYKLGEESDNYLKFLLEELKKRNIKDFRKKK